MNVFERYAPFIRDYIYRSGWQALRAVQNAAEEAIFGADDNVLITASTAYPDAPVILGGRIEKMLEKYPNLYCDCSAGSCVRAFKRDPAYTKKLIETYPTRFLFARDYFDNRLSEFIDGLGLSDGILENFYHGNAERLVPPAQKIEGI